MVVLLIIVVLVLALGGLPATGIHNFGWGPSVSLGTLVVVLLILVLLGRL